MKTFKINDPVYGAEIQVFVDADAHDLDKWGKKNLGQETLFPDIWKCMGGGVMTLSCDVEGRGTCVFYIVWFREKTPSLATIVHEAFHLAAMVLNDRLVEYDPENQEPYAYYLDFLFRQLALKIPTSEIG